MRHEAGKKRDRTPNRWIRWRIIGATGEIGHFHPVREDRNIPVFSKLQDRTGVVEMTMSEINGLRSCPSPKTRFGRFDDLRRAAGRTSVNQSPRPTLMPDKVSIYETDRQPANIRSDAFDRFHEVPR